MAEERFIQGIPCNLEECLEELKDWRSFKEGNITLGDLRNNVRGYGSDGKIYFFFPREEDSIILSLRGDPGSTSPGPGLCYVPLKLDNYGFSKQKQIRISPRRVELCLSEEAKEIYERILNSKDVGLNDLLESVSSMINDSIEFDFDKIIGRHVAPAPYQVRHYEEARKNYTLTGKEVSKGICIDAGLLIRKCLINLGTGGEMGIFCMGTSGETSHDTTVVFDKKTGEWVVINSKSPTKRYNLTPKEKLSELGRPYMPYKEIYYRVSH